MNDSMYGTLRRIADAGRAQETTYGVVLVKKGRRLLHRDHRTPIRLQVTVVEEAARAGLLERHYDANPHFKPSYTLTLEGRRALRDERRARDQRRNEGRRASA